MRQSLRGACSVTGGVHIGDSVALLSEANHNAILIAITANKRASTRAITSIPSAAPDRRARPRIQALSSTTKQKVCRRVCFGDKCQQHTLCNILLCLIEKKTRFERGRCPQRITPPRDTALYSRLTPTLVMRSVRFAPAKSTAGTANAGLWRVCSDNFRVHCGFLMTLKILKLLMTGQLQALSRALKDARATTITDDSYSCLSGWWRASAALAFS